MIQRHNTSVQVTDKLSLMGKSLYLMISLRKAVILGQLLQHSEA